MSDQDIRSILTISLLASGADGETSDSEREQIRRVAAGLGSSSLDVAGLYQDVLLKRVDLAAATSALGTQEMRQLAYEMAVCTCNADGACSEAERRFLEDLSTRLGLDAARSSEHAAQAASMAAAPLDADDPPDPPASSSLSEAELDKLILDAAILNGALELLPQSLSTMAILPLQMRMVYRIGKSYGHTLDHEHIKSFAATLGVGLTSQYLEQVGRKLLGGLLGAIGGRLLGGLGRQAVSSGMSFATTYALGQIARRYYAGGRIFTSQLLRDSFQQMLGQAKDMQAQYLPQMQAQARSLNSAKIMQMVRGA